MASNFKKKKKEFLSDGLLCNCIIHLITFNEPAVMNVSTCSNTDVKKKMGKKIPTIGIARAFPGGRLTHPEGQTEEENE